MKFKYTFLLCAALLFGLSAQGANEYNLSLNVLDGAEGQTNLRLEYRLNESIAVGGGLLSVNAQSGGADFNLLITSGFGRYYWSYGDSLFLGAGLAFASGDYAGVNSGTDTSSGLTAEGGYQWRWRNFHQEAGYEFWQVEKIQAIGGESLRLDFLSEVVYRVGWYF